MTESNNFEIVVLGGGPGGYAAALYGAAAGLNIALVEENRVGGTCLHRGCIPAKALLQSAEVSRTIKHASDFGVSSSEPVVDFSIIQNRKNAVINQMCGGLEGLLKRRKVTVFNSTGVLSSSSDKSVTLSDGAVIKATKALILATGSSPREFPNTQYDGEVILSSDHVLNLDYAPASVVIIGGGAIGCEFASYLNEMGSSITLLEVAPSLLAGCDKDAAAVVQKSFIKRGMSVLTGVNVNSIERKGAKGIVTYTDDKGATQKVESDAVIVSVGRKPRSENIGLNENGIAIDERGFVAVDANMRTNIDGIYAVGDLVATPQLAHVGFGEAMVAIQTILGENPAGIEYGKVPWGIYCHPEVSFCGMTEEKAREAGYDIVVKKEGFIGDGRAVIIGEADGFVKIIAEKDGPILGVHIVGPWATELLAEGYLALNWEATIDDIAPLVHPHPTLSEVFGEAAIALTGRPIHG
ncbi:MAG: dihydrolipoyl dehydrogenase [Acidimicrobiia bacterium]